METNKDVEKILIDQEQIKEICKRLGKEISNDYKDKKLLICAIKNRQMPDFLREITCDCEIDFMAVSSYSGTKTTGVVKFKKDMDVDPDGQDILIVEDILDSGVTLSYLKKVLIGRNAASVRVCTFLDKPANRRTDIEAEYVGAVVPDEFIIGYGLDYNEKYRNLPFVGVLKREVYADK